MSSGRTLRILAVMSITPCCAAPAYTALEEGMIPTETQWEIAMSDIIPDTECNCETIVELNDAEIDAVVGGLLAGTAFEKFFRRMFGNDGGVSDA